MTHQPRIICTVTNDLNFDQRMHRICATLGEAGYDVWLVGRLLPSSKPTKERNFRQIRLKCRNRKGFMFYAEYNVRLLFFLLFTRFDAVCTVDLDTMPAGAMAAFFKNKPGVFDAHEYFTEVPEVVHRRVVRQIWRMVEIIFSPFYQYAYTVGPALAELFTQRYHRQFAVVRNVPNRRPTLPVPHPSGKKILMYQGALNEGRGIEALIEAMHLLPDDFELHLAGEGDLSQPLRVQAENAGLGSRVRFLGFVEPETLHTLTNQAWLGFNLLENKGLSYYYSLANKFFDFVQARVPVITMDFPEYKALNNVHEVAVLLPALNPALIAETVLNLHQQPEQYQRLVNNCAAAAEAWNWDIEKLTLLSVWQKAMPIALLR